ncbi:MAG: type II secretion system F family protein, partial [Planctomycetes bacterium]|nr:type II secretion system F family protein [Planctomycetota bacterium]
MPSYKYEAMDPKGAEVKDEIEATNEDEAQQKIKNMGYFVTKLTKTSGGAKGKKKTKKAGKSRKTFVIGGVSTKMLCTFTRQFSTLQDAGLPLLRSLRILERQMKPSALKNSLIDVVEDVESGSSLS